MTIRVSFSQPSSLTYYNPCQWISDLCRAIHSLVMKIIHGIQERFGLRQNVPTTTVPANTTVNPITTMINIPGPRNVIPFYRGLEANNNLVTLNQILNWGDDQLESAHNYIQWLFPLRTSSAPNPTAPVLDQATIRVFGSDLALKNQLLRSFRRMLTFYGLQMDETSRIITRAPNFNARSAVWLTANNHNFLRITRIIHSLGLLGLPEYSRPFLAIMQDIARNEGSTIITNDTLRYWQGALITT